jgi:hypothetical protein
MKLREGMVFKSKNNGYLGVITGFTEVTIDNESKVIFMPIDDGKRVHNSRFKDSYYWKQSQFVEKWEYLYTAGNLDALKVLYTNRGSEA